MPYRTSRGDYQRASRLGQVPIVESEFVRNRLRGYRVFGNEPVQGVADEFLMPAADISSGGQTVRWALSFDGSYQEVATRPAYPSTRVGYVQIAGVLAYLDRLAEQGRQSLVDPAAVKAAAQESLFSVVMAGSNVCREDMDSVRNSWRADVYELFRDYLIEGQSLLDILLRVLRMGDRTTNAGDVILARCTATFNCTGERIAVPREGTTCRICQGRLFPTDILRIHEEVQELNANETALGRLMNSLEHMALLCYLNYLLERQPRVLASVAFVIDGPLALFGPLAPIKRDILLYLQFMAQQLKARNYGLPVVLGIEKTGQFADHAQEIASYLPNGTLMRLPDRYIYERIVATRPEAQSTFGRDTYYGRKFFYKTAEGQMITLTLPCFDNSLLANGSPDDPACYETLGATMRFLDGVGTRLYQDAIIPVALAHSFAAIPLKTGSKVLTLLSQELLGATAFENASEDRSRRT